MKRGRPFEPGNKFGRGRPPGSRNKKTLLLQELLEEHAPALLRKSLVMALQGNVPMLRLFVDHQLRRLADAPLKIGRLPMRTIEEVIQSQEIILNKLTAGKLTFSQAEQINSILKTRCELLEKQDLERRLHALEQAHGPNGKSSGTDPLFSLFGGVDVAARLQEARQRARSQPASGEVRGSEVELTDLGNDTGPPGSDRN